MSEETGRADGKKVDNASADGSLHGIELQQYVDIYKTSSDRSRLALYVAVVASLLVFIGHRNSERATHPIDVPSQIAEYSSPTILKQYKELLVSKAMFISTPIPGVWISTEDLPLIGGLTLLLLTLVLFVCLRREHEHLYLAFFRVRSLCCRPGHEKGTSQANLLYHSLAMTQVLQSPPTLARRGANIGRYVAILISLAYFVPAGTYLYLLLARKTLLWCDGNLGSREVVIPISIAAGLVGLGLLCWLNSRAMGKRWRSAFCRVNPSSQFVPQMGYAAWLWLIPKWAWERKGITKHTVAETLSDVRILPGEDCGVSVVKVEHWVSIAGRQLRHQDVREMARELTKNGRRKAGTIHPRGIRKLDRFRCETSRIQETDHGLQWTVRGWWYYEYGDVVGT